MSCLLIFPVMVTVNTFVKNVESLNTSLLLAIQRLAKIDENKRKQSTHENETSDSGNRADGF